LPKTSNRIIGFDSETILTSVETDKGLIAVYKPVCFQFYSEDFKKPFIRFFKAEDFDGGRRVFTAKTRSCVFYSFNAEYDFAALSKVIDHDFYCLKAVYNRGRFIKGIIEHGESRWVVYDLMNVFPNFSLEKLGNMLGLPKLEKPECLGKYFPTTAEEFEKFKAYALRDAEICYRAGVWLRRRFGFTPSTLPSLALRYFVEKYKPQWIFEFGKQDRFEAFLRQAYKGGRVECWVRGSPPEKVYVYDVVSLYPYVMANFAFPTGNIPLKEKSTVNLCHEGVADVTVRQDSDIPLLCTRVKGEDGYDRLVFPNGKFRDWFTIAELRDAEMLNVARVEKVHKVLEIYDCRRFFEGYVKEFWQLKESDPQFREFWKLMLNSLYGKFGFTGSGQTYKVGVNGLEKMENSNGNGKILLRRNILIAAYVTALGRLTMYKYYRLTGAENIVYTDTDSIHSFRKLDFSGDGLGDLKFKGEGYGTYIRAKFYILNDMVKCRGLPRMFSANDVRNMIKRGSVTAVAEKLLRLRLAHVRGFPALTNVYQLTNFSLDEDGKRVYRKKLNGEMLLKDYTESVPLTLMRC